jgi:hypothetical protein
MSVVPVLLLLFSSDDEKSGMIVRVLGVVYADYRL